MRKEVTVCDGCGKILDHTREIYHLNLKTDKFWDGVETGYALINLDFCKKCAKDIKNTLEKIEKRLEQKGQNEI